jgi:hypothetical protein
MKRSRAQKSNPNTLSIIREEISKSKIRADYGKAGAIYIENVTNPKGNQLSGIRKQLIPDSNRAKARIVTFKGTTTYTAVAGHLSGIIQIPDYNLTGAVGVTVDTGADAFNPALTQTTNQVQAPIATHATFEAWRAAITGYMRPHSGFLKINCNSPAETAGGRFRPSLSEYPVRSAIGTWFLNSYFHKFTGNRDYNIKEGCTVSYRARRESDLDFAGPPAHEYGTDINWTKPTVLFDQLTTSTVLTIEWEMSYEVTGIEGLSFIALDFRTCEEEFDMIQSELDKIPWHSKGHSFKSFIKAIGKGIGGVVRFVTKAIPVVGGIVNELL